MDVTMDAPEDDDLSFKGVFAVFHTIQIDVAGVKTDVAVLKTDVSEIKNDITEIRTTVEGHTGDIRVLKGDFTAFCNRTKEQFTATDTNALARLMNSRATHPVCPLEPLRTSDTNQDIPGLPKTAGEIDSMNGPAVEGVLQALGITVGNTIQENRQRLKRALGIIFPM